MGATCRELRQYFADTARSFFFAPVGQFQESDDHLVEVVRRDPSAAAWFIVYTMFFNVCGTVFTSALSFGFLYLHWGGCASCDRPLRLWLLLQAIVQVGQVPVRLVILTTVRAVSQGGGDLEASVKSLTGSQAWSLSKRASLVLYAWFILGFVWWFHSTECETCPGIEPLTSAVMGLSLARAAVALVVFWLLFPQLEPEPSIPDSVHKVVPATMRQIHDLGVVRFSRLDCKEISPHTGEPSCAVCISEFDTGDLVRRLPCRHLFHKECIDHWLRKNKRCPLCMVAIDEQPADQLGFQSRAFRRPRSCNIGAGASR